MNADAIFARLNPLLQKEMRATFRTRRFRASFMGALMIMAAIVVIMVTGMALDSRGNIAPARIGRNIFYAFQAAMFFVVLFLLPAFTASSLAGEKEVETYDLLITTSLRPWNIVWGKLLASLSYAFVFFAGSLPLVSICFLFGGVGPLDILTCYGLLFLCAVLVNSLSLMFSATHSNSRKAVGGTYAVLFLLILPGLSLVPAFLRGRAGFLLGRIPPEAWAWAGFLYMALIILFFLAATNALKSPAENRSTNLRIYVCGVSLIATALGLWSLELEFTKAKEPWFEDHYGFLICVGCVCLVLPLLFCAEPVRLSRRVRQSIERSRKPFRTWTRLFYPGAQSGFIFSFAWTVFLFILWQAGLCLILRHSIGVGLDAVAVLLAALVFYSSIGLLMAGFEWRPRSIRGLTILLLILAYGAPPTYFFVRSAERQWRRHPVSMNLYFLNPGIAAWSGTANHTAMRMSSDNRIFFNKIGRFAPADAAKVKAGASFVPKPGKLPWGLVLQYVPAIPFYLFLSLVCLVLARPRLKRIREAEQCEDEQAGKRPQPPNSEDETGN